MKACGCREIDEMTSECCALHFAALEFDSFAHDPGHLECCDAPFMRRLLGDYGGATMRAVVAISRRQQYAARVFEEATRERRT